MAHFTEAVMVEVKVTIISSRDINMLVKNKLTTVTFSFKKLVKLYNNKKERHCREVQLQQQRTSSLG